MQKRKLLRVEQEEAKKIQIEVNLAERKRAMQVCAQLGFTLSSVEGVQDIKPKALGMKGKEVDFDILKIGSRPSELKIKDDKIAELGKGVSKANRVDLGRIADESRTKVLTPDGTTPRTMEGDFISLNFGGGVADGQEFEALNYNHKLRRKLHRAIEAAQIQKELLVRAKAKEHCEKNNIPIPPELVVEYKPIKLSGRRILEDGSIETEKQERVRKRLELAEYNKAAKVLRQQAKAEAIEAGLRIFAQLTGKQAIDAQDVPGRFLLGDIADNTQHQSKSESLASKKRQRHDDEMDTRMAKKSEHLSISADFVSTGKPVDYENKVKTGKRMKYSEESTPHLVKSDAETLSESKEAKIKTKKRKESEVLRQPVINSTRDDVASNREKRPEEKLKRQSHLTKDTDEDNMEPEVTSNSTFKKAKKTKINKDEIYAVPSHLENEKTTKQSSKKDRTSAAEIEDSAKSGEQWNIDALTGDMARKDKFLRLLGAGKSNSIEKPAKKIKAKSVDITQVEGELQRQFEAGIRMKHDSQAKRRGLGA